MDDQDRLGGGDVESWSQRRLQWRIEHDVEESRELGGGSPEIEATAHGLMLADEPAAATVGLLDANDEMAMLRQYVVRCPDR